ICDRSPRRLPPPSSSHILTTLHLLPSFFFFNDPAPTEIYTLSLHDALPIPWITRAATRTTGSGASPQASDAAPNRPTPARNTRRSEEHTSELQSLTNLVCRLLLEKKKKAGSTRSNTSTQRARTP